MNFEERARKARRRGDAVRAAVVLIEGLKREPMQSSALDLLFDIFAEQIDSPGLGVDLADVVSRRPDSYECFEALLDELYLRHKDGIAKEIVRGAADRGIDLQWPPASPLPEDDSSEDSDHDDLQVPDKEAPPAPEVEPPPPEESRSDAVTESPATKLEDGGAAAEQGLESPDEEPEQLAFEDLETPDQKDQQDEVDDEPSREDSADESLGERSLWRRRALIAALLLVALGGLAVWLYRAGMLGPRSLGERIERVDPIERASIDEVFSNAVDDPADSSATDEQLAFLEAVRAAEWGEASASVPSEETHWGVATAAVSHALQGEFEEAVSRAKRLEHRHPDELVTYWTAGFVEETRGRYASASKHYRRGREDFPDFAPLTTGQLRLSMRQGRGDAAKKLQVKLEEMSPDNPFATMPVDVPDIEELSSGTGDFDDEVSERSSRLPTFVEATYEFHDAMRAVAGGDDEAALAAIRQTLKAEPDLSPALMVAGALKAAALQVDGADKAFTKLARLPGLSREYRWTLQTVAPRALLGVGRADLAYKFVPPVRGAGRVTERLDDETREPLPQPVVPLLSVEEAVEEEPLAGRAVLERARVVSALGFGPEATESLELVAKAGHDQAEVTVVRSELAIHRGDHQEVRVTARRADDDRAGHTVAAALAYHEGEYERAIGQARKARKLAGKVEPIAVIRFLALGYSKAKRGREALAVLDEADVSIADKAALGALRMRVLGRLDSRSESVRSAVKQLGEVGPTSIDRLVDLADVAFWTRDFEAAGSHCESALEMSEGHPEANWIAGLLEQVEGDDTAARRHFRRAWRQDPNDPSLLVELGRIYLALGEAERAQATFYRALLRDRKNVDALEGLGAAYRDFDRSRGVRDVGRIARSYEDSSRYAAQAAVAYKWLAILHGSREGKPEALDYLERAVEALGEAPQLLVEQGHYYQSREEFDRARKLYARALEKNATYAEARLGLARMALEEGDTDVARTQLERYLAQEPTGENARWARERLQRLDSSEAE